MSYSRMKMSLKERKKHAKSTKKTLHSPGDMIQSDSDPDTDNATTPSHCNKLRLGSVKDYELVNKLNSKNEPGIYGGEDDLVIVDVCCDKKVFQSFVNEFKSVESYSFAVAIEGAKDNSDDIGTNILSLDNGNIHGISFCFVEKMQAFYICLKQVKEKDKDKELNISCQNPDMDKRISFEEKIKFLR